MLLGEQGKKWTNLKCWKVGTIGVTQNGYPMVVKVSLGRLINEGFKRLIYLAAVQFTNCVFKLASFK